MRKITNLIIRGSLFSAVALVVSMTACKNEELQNQIMMLGNDKIIMSNQKDSLIRLLNESRTIYDTLASNYINLTVEKKILLSKIKSLQSGYNARGTQLKEMESEKAVMKKIIASQNAYKDSITNVLALLNSQISDLKRSVSDRQAENNALNDIIKTKDIRIAADSLAEVERLSAPREYGFVDIVAMAGGLGLGIRNMDYEKHLISFDNIFGYQINRNFITGVGTGIHFYDGGVLVPLFLDLRYQFENCNFKPFLSADGGFLLNFNDFDKTNTFIQPLIGLTRKIGQKVFLNLSTGLTIIQTPPPYHRSSFFTIKASLSIPGKKGPEI